MWSQNPGEYKKSQSQKAGKRKEKKGTGVNSNKIARRQLIHLLRGGKSENLYQTQRQKETGRERARAILFYFISSHNNCIGLRGESMNVFIFQRRYMKHP